MALLSDPEIDDGLAAGEWRRDGRTIVRELAFEDFSQAIAFVNRVADAAQVANHHPDIHVHGWNKVRLELSTHSEGGLTRADLDMAARIDRLV
ncbi:MAG: 4a-hydroxytetrahydrobiopterin dehydratase [Solirubrobacteraceae bacterium]